MLMFVNADFRNDVHQQWVELPALRTRIRSRSVTFCSPYWYIVFGMLGIRGFT
jgi:hypothetical protein